MTQMTHCPGDPMTQFHVCWTHASLSPRLLVIGSGFFSYIGGYLVKLQAKAWLSRALSLSPSSVLAGARDNHLRACNFAKYQSINQSINQSISLSTLLVHNIRGNVQITDI